MTCDQFLNVTFQLAIIETLPGERRGILRGFLWLRRMKTSSARGWLIRGIIERIA